MAFQSLNWRKFGFKDLEHSMHPLEGTRATSLHGGLEAQQDQQAQ
jgi:hypothetical protein